MPAMSSAEGAGSGPEGSALLSGPGLPLEDVVPPVSAGGAEPPHASKVAIANAPPTIPNVTLMARILPPGMWTGKEGSVPAGGLAYPSTALTSASWMTP